MSGAAWSRKALDASITGRAYNSDWWETLTPETEPELWVELRSIFEEEQALPDIPSWAENVAVYMMEPPMCGCYAYPANVTQVLDAIAAQHYPEFWIGCYSVDPGRKVLLAYYVYCLDAWLKDAPLAQAVDELSLRDALDKDWAAIVPAVYQALGERNALKELALERLIHRLRWWIKSLTWPGDKRDHFLLDVYSGDIRGEAPYRQAPYGDPFFAELRLSHVQALEERIRAEVPDGERLVDHIRCTWLCAPKVFRYVERLIVWIGGIGANAPLNLSASILQCEDTYPDFAAYRAHYRRLRADLRAWLDGQVELFPALAPATPLKHWLVHLLWHQLGFSAQYEGNCARLFGGREHGKEGTGRPVG